MRRHHEKDQASYLMLALFAHKLCPPKGVGGTLHEAWGTLSRSNQGTRSATGARALRTRPA